MIARARRQDWFLYGAVFLLAVMSLIAIGSANPRLFFPQLIWFGLGFLALFFFSNLDWRPIINYRWIVFGMYGLVLVLLAFTVFVSPSIRGVKGWLVLGSLRFQVSELAKVAVLILLAHFFARKHVGIANVHNIIRSFVYVILPTILVMKEPDLGSALVFFGIWVGFLLVSGLRAKHFLIGVFVVIFIFTLSWNFFLRDYQRERVVGFWRPAYDPLGINYSVIQSKIAIGSAGFFGKGFQQGTQVQLGFLPEAATDFIFAAFVEEWGYAGMLFLIGLFLFIIYRILKIGWHAPNNFSRFICLGTVLMFMVEFFLNVGSNIGLVPVVGITFPLFSYGGSSLLTKFMALGIIQSIAGRSLF